MAGRVGVASVVLLVLSSVAAPARASEPFPKAVQTALAMECKPHCTICHVDDMGGYDRLRPGGFGSNLKAKYRLIPRDPGTVGPAIEAARLGKLDSDGDEVIDVDELAEGRDPNDKSEEAYVCGDLAPKGPEYGCGSGSQIATGRSPDVLAALAAAAVLNGGMVRARRRTL